MRRTLLLAAVVPAATQALSGQNPVQPPPGSVEIGVFAGFTRFDRSLRLDNSYGVGGRLGVYVLPGLALEGAGSTMPTRGPLTAGGRLTSLHARLVYTTRPAGPVALLLGGGVVHYIYDTNGNVSDDGVSGQLGFRLGRGAWGVRVVAIGDFIPAPANQSATVANNWNFAAQAGLSVTFGASRHEAVPREQLPPREPPPTPLGPAPQFRVDTTPQPPLALATKRADTVRAAPPPPPVAAAHEGVGDAARDSDGDGVKDAEDRCPNTPLGVRVDVATGCPIPKDTDGDGVPDNLDRCPGTPRSERTDAVGCPMLFEGTQRTLVLEGVRFESGGAALTMEGRAVLDRVALSLKAHREFWVEVAGYTDNVGNPVANRRLSELRAEAVRRYLIACGVPATQLLARGYGATDPIDANDTAVGRARNRRVELHRLS